MCHEHQNPRGQPIQWNDQKVYQWAAETQGWDKETTKHNILEHYNISQINGSDFDPLSVMLYFFPAELTINNQGTKQNLRLSGEDVLWINKNYSVGAPQSADDFYKKVYGISLQKAIQLSGNFTDVIDTKINQEMKTAMIKNVLKLALFIFVVIMIILLIKKLFGQRSKKFAFKYPANFF